MKYYSKRTFTGVVYSIPILYGITLIIIAAIDHSNPRLCFTYLGFGCLSFITGLIGLYGVFYKQSWPLLIAFPALVIISSVVFILSTIILTQLIHKKPFLADFSPTIATIITNKIVAITAIVILYATSITACVGFSDAIDFQVAVERESQGYKIVEGEKIQESNNEENLVLILKEHILDSSESVSSID